jgi:hypothetical protein
VRITITIDTDDAAPPFTIEEELHEMKIDLTDLTAEVAATATAEQAAVVLIQGIASQIADNASDEAAVTALAAQLKTNAAALSAALVAPAPPAPAPVPA